jgi:hypothetical protein
MRSIWPFIAGVIVAIVVNLVSLPILGAAGLAIKAAGWLGGQEAWLGGGSSFFIKDDHGRYVTRLVNTTYTILSVPMVGEPRPRRLLLRQYFSSGDDGDGQARFDAWPMGSPAELRRPPLYTIRARASSAGLGDDGMIWTEKGGRRTAFAVADGNRLFDADLPLVQFSFEPDARRMAALSVADDEFTAKGGVAVISYAAPGRVLKRVVLVAEDPMRASMMRATLSASKLVTYTDEALGGRLIELPLAAGPVRIPVAINDLDLGRAVVPAGLRLVPLKLWD